MTTVYINYSHFVSSESSSFMASKLAPPTPTMMMDMGRCEAAMMACLVATMSDIAPSVNMRRMKYCYNVCVCVGGGGEEVQREHSIIVDIKC